MTEEMKQKRDELARKEHNDLLNDKSDPDYCAGVFDGIKVGFDACYKLMEAENSELKINPVKCCLGAHIDGYGHSRNCKGGLSNIADDFSEIIKENSALKSRIEKLRAALEFYGSKDNWTLADEKNFSSIKCNTFPIGDSDCDYCLLRKGYIGGSRARAALKADEGEG